MKNIFRTPEDQEKAFEIMIPKTEPAENIPRSLPLSSRLSASPMSMDSIVKHLRSLEKHYIADKEKTQTRVETLEFENSRYIKELEDKNSKIEKLEKENSMLGMCVIENSQSKEELEDMKLKIEDKNSKIEKLEEENSKLKADLGDVSDSAEQYDSERMRYWRDWSWSERSNRDLRRENRSLEAKIKLLESSESTKDMKSKTEMLEKQISQLKSDLEASDSDKTLYYNQYQRNGKKVRGLETENESLKAKIKLLESSESTAATKRKRIPSSSSEDDSDSSSDEERILEIIKSRVVRLSEVACIGPI